MPSDPHQFTLLRERLAHVEGRIQAACQRAGRRRDEVTLVCVTKSVEPQIAALLPELGIVDLAENRPQELWRKSAALKDTVRWHLIGHLQRNKIARTLPLVHLVHSVDSLRLLQALESEAAAANRIQTVLLEVHASGEPTKQGLAIEEMPPLLALIHGLKWVRVRGLMGMAAFEEDPQRCRPTFARVRELAAELANSLETPHAMTHLSMGMSNDYEVAIEEGATLVRLGTAILEGMSGHAS